jgi:hypothetical protein
MVTPDVGIGMNGNRGHFQLAPAGPLIEGLDIRQLVDVAQLASIHFAFGQRVEHEGIVRVGAVGEVNGSWYHGPIKAELEEREQ